MSKHKTNKKVYLISSSQTDLSSLIRTIRNQGYKLIEDEGAKNQELVGRIRASHPDLIVWDEQSFNQDSLATLQKLRDHTETKVIPVYLLLSQNGSVDRFADDLEAFQRVSTLSKDLDEGTVAALLDDVLRPNVSVKFWGVRGSTPCANKENIEYGGNTTCVQIEHPFSDELLILDSGTGIRNLGNYLTEFRDDVRGHIFITHPHWDHIQGFPFFKPIYNSQNDFKIHMPPQVTGGCREILSGHLTKTFFPVTLDMFDANLEYITQGNELHQYNGYSIEYMLTNHPINTAAYKVRIAGKTIVFCPDNELTPITQKTNAYFYKKLKEFFKDVDLLVHDAQYNLDIYQDKAQWGHSAWETAVDFAKRSRVKNLFLTHHDPDSTDTYLKQLDERIQEEFGDQFESVQLAKEGVKVQLEIGETVSE